MQSTIETPASAEQLSFEAFRQEVIADYRIAALSRHVSLMGRREVLTGKAKFGIFGDGKELPQIAVAKFFQPGDWRSGYYRDQTWMMALGIVTPQTFFAQLYADPQVENDPFSAGRQMNAHFSTPNVNKQGQWANLASQYNTATDMAPTAGQMPRSLGLAYASRLFRNLPQHEDFATLSNNGDEVCFCSIGDASTSEGMFWETVNAACVSKVPLAIFVWDDGYGISVPKEFQTTKGSISLALQGFEMEEGSNGLKIYTVKAWDYAGLCEVFEKGIQEVRVNQVPAIFHVKEVTQPQGHSTSGSHERYKSTARIEWEKEWDCIKKFREWILANELAEAAELDQVEVDVRSEVRDAKERAWKDYIGPIKEMAQKVLQLVEPMVHRTNRDQENPEEPVLDLAYDKLKNIKEPLRGEVMRLLNTALNFGDGANVKTLRELKNTWEPELRKLYNSQLFVEGAGSALSVEPEAPKYGRHRKVMNGYEVLNNYFDQLFKNNPKVVAFGEDVGKIGDVNQGFAGLQAKYGNERIFDTGIREATIIGTGVGLALRGFRPIAEIQYLDYLLYGLQPLSDDVATLHYRSAGNQRCPLIVRTRGHRLEGIWHSGSPMGMVINSLRGMYVCVPRNMVQAAGMYNTLLAAQEPALVIECLNGYRLKEELPENLATCKVPLGIPEIIREGTDLTIVSYGSTLRIIQKAAELLMNKGIEVEIVDVQTLLPFDRHHAILASLKKTSRILFVDEDVPGGASAYMFQQVLEVQGGYQWLDATPRTLSAKEHRPAYGSDGDYFSKPNVDDIVAAVLEIVAE